jgi:hypothetical protein
MATVIFIHGISNMPEPNVLKSLWENAFAIEKPNNPGLEIGAYGANVELVYWSDVLYKDFAKTRSGAENSTISLEMSNAVHGDSPSLEDVSKAWAESLSQELDVNFQDLVSPVLAQSSDIDSDRISEAAAEAIPLPWPLKKPLMRAFLRDAHHYLFDVKYSPRQGVSYHVRQELRKRFVSKVIEAKKAGPVIVVAHSLGTVIAYDCLKNVNECPQIQSLITVGSPLGMSEMQDKLMPGYTAENGYAYEKIIGEWHNVYDSVDIVSRADPILRNDYLQNGKERIIDIRQKNGGVWTHGMLKYAAQIELRGVLRKELSML